MFCRLSISVNQYINGGEALGRGIISRDGDGDTNTQNLDADGDNDGVTLTLGVTSGSFNPK